MLKSTDLATVILAADRLESAGRLALLLDTFNADPIVSNATNDKRHRATASKPGKVIVRNERASKIDKTTAAVAVLDRPEAPVPVKAPANNGDLGYGFKADGTPRKSADPVWLRNKTAVKPVQTTPRKSKVNKAADKSARTLDTTPGSMTRGQERRIRTVADQHGIRVRIISTWSMADASAYYKALVAKVA